MQGSATTEGTALILNGTAMVGRYGIDRPASTPPDFTTQRFLRDLCDSANARPAPAPSPQGDDGARGREASG